MSSSPIVILTRPEASAPDFADRLKSSKAQVILSPVIKLARVDELPTIHDDEILIFTSNFAVSAVRPTLSLNARSAYAAGPTTARSVQAAGAKLLGTAADSAALAGLIIADDPAQRLVHLCGEHVTPGGVADLGASLPNFRSQVVYRQDELELSEQAKAQFKGEDTIILPLFSRRSAAIVAAQLGSIEISANVQVVAIGNAVAAAAKGIKAQGLTVASEPNADAMYSAIEKVIARVG